VLANDADPDGDPLTVSITTQPFVGTAAVNSNGTVAPTDLYVADSAAAPTRIAALSTTSQRLVTFRSHAAIGRPARTWPSRSRSRTAARRTARTR
jgi:hypothetical protein